MKKAVPRYDLHVTNAQTKRALLIGTGKMETIPKKSVEKCIKHGQAIFLGSANEKYNHKMGYRTLWVFEQEGTMKANYPETKTKSLLFTLARVLFIQVHGWGKKIRFLEGRNQPPGPL